MHRGRSSPPHRLITDDTGTQGRGNIQIEFTTGQRTEQEDGARETTVNRHMAGVGLDVKRPFYERENLGLAPRPGLTPPATDFTWLAGSTVCF